MARTQHSTEYYDYMLVLKVCMVRRWMSKTVVGWNCISTTNERGEHPRPSVHSGLCL